MTGVFSRQLLTLPVKMREEDKRKHVVWSLWSTLAASVFVPGAQAFILVFLIGLSRECWDHFYGSGFCVYDMFGNFLGMLLALTLALAVSGIVS